MPRLCHDCGIADSQDCQCDPHAGVGHPVNPYQQAEQLRPRLPLTPEQLDREPAGKWAMRDPGEAERDRACWPLDADA